MKKRYFFWFSAAFLLGIVLASGMQPHVVLCSVAGTFLGAALFYKYGYGKTFLFAAFGVLLGAICFSWHFSGYRSELEEIDGKSVTLSGRVTKAEKQDDGMCLFVRGRIESIGFFCDDIGAYVYTEGETAPAYGDIITVRAAASVPHAAKNFGEVDMRAFYMGRGVSAFLHPKAEDVEVIGHSFSRIRPADAAHALRQWVQKQLAAHTDGKTEGFLRAFLTGDKSLLAAEETTRLSKAGLSHIVAVSGLHLGVVLGGVLAFFGILKMRRRLFSVCFYLLFIWFFVLFTGASVSVLRAAIMLSVFFLADFFRRQNDSLTALAFAAFSLCLVNPGVLFDVSFQLSASSTLGILLFAESFSKRLSFLPRVVCTTCAASLAAFLGFMPLAAYHFGTVSVVGLLANVLVCPMLAPLLFLGFAAVALGNVPLLGAALYFLLDKGVLYVLKVAELAAYLPGTAVSFGKISPFTIFAYLLFLVSVYLRTAKKNLCAAGCLSLAILVSCLTLLGNLFTYHHTAVTFLSAAQSDAAVVTHGKVTVLFDGGGSLYTDTGERTVLPYLRREGIRKIDAAFVTAYHTENVRGVISLLENGYIETLYLPSAEGGEWKAELARVAGKCGTRVRYLGDGDAVRIGDSTVCAMGAFAKSEENHGLAYRLSVPGGSVLFAGDIEDSGARRLLWRGADLSADVLSVGKHTVLPEFLAAVSPKLSVVSGGEMPAAHRTDESAVRVRISPSGEIRTEPYRLR